jgi:hypothetical protein
MWPSYALATLSCGYGRQTDTSKFCAKPALVPGRFGYRHNAGTFEARRRGQRELHPNTVKEVSGVNRNCGISLLGSKTSDARISAIAPLPAELNSFGPMILANSLLLPERMY